MSRANKHDAREHSLHRCRNDDGSTAINASTPPFPFHFISFHYIPIYAQVYSIYLYVSTPKLSSLLTVAHKSQPLPRCACNKNTPHATLRATHRECSAGADGGRAVPRVTEARLASRVRVVHRKPIVQPSVVSPSARVTITVAVTVGEAAGGGVRGLVAAPATVPAPASPATVPPVPAAVRVSGVRRRGGVVAAAHPVAGVCDHRSVAQGRRRVNPAVNGRRNDALHAGRVVRDEMLEQ